MTISVSNKRDLTLLDRLREAGNSRPDKVVKIGTHASSIHADECLAIAVLEVALPGYKIEVVRSRNAEYLKENTDILVDIGGGRYDHHTTACAETYPNGVKMAACGKVLRDVETNKAIYNQLLWSTFYAVEAADNGQPENFLPPGCPRTKFGFVPSMNPTWEEGTRSDEEMMTYFMEIKEMCRKIYVRSRVHAKACVNAQTFLPKCPRSFNNRFITLPLGGVPWLSFAYKEKDLLGAIYPDVSRRGITVIRLAKVSGASKQLKVAFPENWRGKEGHDLKKACGMSGAVFCHPGGFLMTVSNAVDVVKVCQIVSDLYDKQQREPNKKSPFEEYNVTYTPQPPKEATTDEEDPADEQAEA